MPAAMVGDDHTIGANLDAKLDILPGHDALSDDRQASNRFDPLQIFPSRRRISATGMRAAPGPEVFRARIGIIDAATIAIVIANVALAFGRPLRIQSDTDRLVARILGALEPVFSHFAVAKRVELEP